MPQKRSRSPPPEIMEGIIEKMLKGEEFETVQILKLHQIHGNAGVLSDGSHSQPVWLLGEFSVPSDILACVVSVQGYVTSTCNQLGSTFLALTNYTIEVKTSTSQLLPKYRFKKQNQIQGGNFGDFLLEKAPFLSNDDLCGRRIDFYPLDDFVSQCNARITLSEGNFLTTLSQFQTAQQDRQEAALNCSNAGREIAAKSKAILDNHAQAMSDMLEHANSGLTRALLQRWHSIICHDLDDQAGEIRTKPVRVGITKCTPCQKLNGALEDFMEGITQFHKNTNFVVFAAAVLFGILDIHPFSDGNGRLARLCCNWALAKAGVPFVVCLFATPAQRKEYSRAIEQTRCNLSLTKRGTGVTNESLHQAFQSAGYLAPLVQLLVDRLTKTIAEFEKICEESSAKASEEEEFKAAKRFRERQAQGSCLICFDEKPNIATLCCGKAVHMNCMAQWLSSKNSCPQCRAELPELPQSQQHAALDISEAENARQAILSLQEHLQNIVEDIGADQFDWEDGEDFTTAMDEDDNDDENEADNDTEDDTDDNVVGEQVNNNDTTEADSDGDGSTTFNDNNENYHPPICQFGNCRNRPAIDCFNDGCGRCCVLYGTLSCQRHGVL